MRREGLRKLGGRTGCSEEKRSQDPSSISLPPGCAERPLISWEGGVLPPRVQMRPLRLETERAVCL
jgi:hypothetical protein